MLLYVVLLAFLCFGVVYSRKPNIIVITASDLGWTDVGYHGDEMATPNIDALAYNGIILERYYTQQGSSATKAAFLTGMYPMFLGYQGDSIQPGEHRQLNLIEGRLTLPQALKQLGYATHLVGKWHLGASTTSAMPQAFGYDTHYGFLYGKIGYYDHSTGGPVSMRGIDFYQNGNPLNVSGYVTDLLTRRSVEIINSNKKDVPLFLMISHLAASQGRMIAGNSNYLEPVEKITDVHVQFNSFEKRRKILSNVIARLDDSIGTIIETLKNVGMLNDTIVVFTSDNGAKTEGAYSTFGFNWPLRGQKSSLYEGVVRVPALIYYLGSSDRGRTLNHLFHVSDWLPTLYSAAGGDTTNLGGISGINQWTNIISNEIQDLRKEVLVNLNGKKDAAIIDYNGHYKLVYDPNPINDQFYGSYSFNLTYNWQLVLASKTFKSLIDFETRTPQQLLDKYMKLRTKTDFRNCRTTQNPPRCTTKCLFDLWDDPCESVDLSHKVPNITENLWNKIVTAQIFEIPAMKEKIELAANPSKCNGFWFPWHDGPNGCRI